MHSVLEETMFKVDSNSGMHIQIPLIDKVTVVSGYSATGKTMMLNKLKALQDNPNEIKYSNISLDKIHIISRRIEMYDSSGLIDISDNVVFIDRYPVVINDEIENFIRKSYNKFVLFSHSALNNLPTSIFSLLALEYNQNTDTYSTVQLTKSNQWAI